MYVVEEEVGKKMKKPLTLSSLQICQKYQTHMKDLTHNTKSSVKLDARHRLWHTNLESVLDIRPSKDKDFASGKL